MSRLNDAEIREHTHAPVVLAGHRRLAEASWNACIAHLQTEEGVKESIDSIIKREREQALKDVGEWLFGWCDKYPCRRRHCSHCIDMLEESLPQGRMS